VSVHPSAAYRFDAVTEGTVDYSYSADRLAVAGGIRTEAQTATVGIKRRLSSRDTASVDYGFRQFLFGLDELTTSQALTTSQVVTVGWSHNITPLASLTLHGGPRVSDRVAAPELSVSFRYQLRSADLALMYSRGQATIIGVAGPADTHSLAATAIYRPRPSVYLHMTPGIFRSARSGAAAEVYRLALGARRSMTRWLSLDASYDLNVQHGDIYAVRTHDRMSRHVALVRLLAAPPEGPKRN
jgi:hypothetical protein